MNKEEKINEYFKHIFSEQYSLLHLILLNMNALKKSQEYMEKKLIIAKNMKHANLENLTEMDFLSSIELVKRFYADMQIEYDIEKAVQNGTISISEPKNTFKKTLTGMSYRAGENVIADVTNNNCISDAVILSHELAHVRNNTKKYVYTRKFLTETTSYAEQLVFTDYLKKLGYENDSDILNIQELWNLWRFNFSVYEIIRLLDLYNLLGHISLENWIFLYGSQKGYYEAIDRVYSLIYEHKNNIFDPIYYSIALTFAPYMLEKYKENPQFFTKIKYLTDNLNTIGMGEFLETIGLSNEEEEIENIMSPYLDKYKKECEEAYDKQRRLVK